MCMIELLILQCSVSKNVCIDRVNSKTHLRFVYRVFHLHMQNSKVIPDCYLWFVYNKKKTAREFARLCVYGKQSNAFPADLSFIEMV